MSANFTRLSGLGLITAILTLAACQPADDHSQTSPEHTATDTTEAMHEHHEEHEMHEHHEEDEIHEHHEHEALEDEHAEHDAHHDHEHHHDINYIALHCEPEADISVYYHTDVTPKTAHLLIDGIEYDLTEDKALQLESYTSNLGLDESHGLVWQRQDSQASLFSVPVSMVQAQTFDDQSQLSAQNRLYQCEQAS